MADFKNILDFKQININDIALVGGKNANLGELINNLSSLGVSVPGGFAITTKAFETFIKDNNLENKIYDALNNLDVDDLTALKNTGKKIRDLVLNSPLSGELEDEIKSAYENLTKMAGDNASFAVRSSATAEDLPDASFAGQQETILNVKGIDEILGAVKIVYASLFNDRAIAYRVHNKYSHKDVSISIGIQQMVRSDLGVSGVMFSIDTESGFEDVVLINSSYGLGELVVQGAVNPDEFYVHKPLLKKGNPAVIRRTLGTKASKMIYETNNKATVKVVDVTEQLQLEYSLSIAEIEQLAHFAMLIEEHYKRPMDIEWAKDGNTNQIYILQARPETVRSRKLNSTILERYQLNEKGRILVEGRSVGQKIGQGVAKVIHDINDMHLINPGDVLVADMTDPDWEPIMKKASAIVTNRGGRTCHAAIIARELGIPAVVGCQDATKIIPNNTYVTVSCAEGDSGYVYEGLLKYEKLDLSLDTMPNLPVKVMLNVGNPERAFAFQAIPNAGVGLARLEFLISNNIGIHPKALLLFDELNDLDLKEKIRKKVASFSSPVEFYIEKLKEGIATIAAAFYPKPVIVRLSDFKSNEYANLLGGNLYEPKEENPMLGFRGASRYASPFFEDCFALECKAVKRVREEMGLTNVEIMIPFVRTIDEATNVINVLKKYGLERRKHALRIIMMCELPSNALLAEQFLEFFDGFSIGSNDLTQLTLGLDRDSSLIAGLFDERDAAVKKLLHMAIKACREKGKYIGICGQGPSDHPDFAKWLMQEGIDSMSLNPDSVLETSLFLEKHLGENDVQNA